MNFISRFVISITQGKFAVYDALLHRFTPYRFENLKDAQAVRDRLNLNTASTLPINKLTDVPVSV